MLRYQVIWQKPAMSTSNAWLSCLPKYLTKFTHLGGKNKVYKLQHSKIYIIKTTQVWGYLYQNVKEHMRSQKYTNINNVQICELKLTYTQHIHYFQYVILIQCSKCPVFTHNLVSLPIWKIYNTEDDHSLHISSLQAPLLYIRDVYLRHCSYTGNMLNKI